MSPLRIVAAATERVRIIAAMKILVNTDSHMEGSEGLIAHATSAVEKSLTRFVGRVSRVDVHLVDESSHKGTPDDKRCVMKASVQGRDPIAVTHHAASVHQAIDGALDKLRKAIEHALDRKDQR